MSSSHIYHPLVHPKTREVNLDFEFEFVVPVPCFVDAVGIPIIKKSSTMLPKSFHEIEKKWLVVLISYDFVALENLQCKNAFLHL